MQGLPPRTVAESRSTVVRLMVPTDANFVGNVFGSQILAEIDRVAYVTATRHARQTCVTASIDRMDFIAPVHVGEMVEWDAQITYVGHSSMEVWIRVHAEGLSAADRRLVGEAFVTMVAVDGSGRPTSVPPLDLANESERARFREAEARVEARRRTRRTGPSREE